MTKEELEKEAIKCMHEIKYWLRVPIKKETEKDGISEILKLTEPREKRIADLEEKISILLSCKNCPGNKGGLLCQKEYEEKCLAQKIQYIKELGKENAELKASKDEAIKKLIADMAGLEEELSEKDRQIGELENDMTTAISLLEKAECTSCIYTDSPCVRGDYPMKDGHCTHHKHFSDEIAILKAQIEKMKCCENCKHHYFIGDELECHLLDNGISCDDKEKWEIKEK